MTRVLRAANEERRGETFFARAKGDVRQKWLGATDGERRGEKYFAPTMDGRVCEKVCEHIDDWQRSGWRSGDGVTMAIVGAKNISPVPKMM